MELSPRLRALFDAVVPGKPCADVGTDHGKLAVALALEKRVPKVIASDVGEKPLGGARELVNQRWRSQWRVELRLGDGLAPLEPAEVATVVVAGMGGARIRAILDAHPAVVAACERLVLQANTDVPALRQWVVDRGHHLEDERLVVDQGKWYAVLVVTPDGTRPDPGWSDLDREWGPLLRARRDPELRRFLGAELPRVAQALAQAQAGGASGAVLAGLACQLDDIERELAVLAMADGGLKGRG